MPKNYGQCAHGVPIGYDCPECADFTAMEEQHGGSRRANDRQVGGTHWQAEYQHWDFVCDVDLHYLLACASKYVFRWHAKNGVEDLAKAIHYLEKAQERGIQGPEMKLHTSECLTRFLLQCRKEDAYIIAGIVHGNYARAINSIKWLIKNAASPESA